MHVILLARNKKSVEPDFLPVFFYVRSGVKKAYFVLTGGGA